MEKGSPVVTLPTSFEEFSNLPFSNKLEILEECGFPLELFLGHKKLFNTMREIEDFLLICLEEGLMQEKLS